VVYRWVLANSWPINTPKPKIYKSGAVIYSGMYFFKGSSDYMGSVWAQNQARPKL
jgi:hypothetical protein